MTTATLEYTVTAVGPTVPANLEAAMAAVDLDFSAIETITGCTFVSDNTSVAGNNVSRVIVFTVSTAQFDAEFPVGTDQAAPFYGLYTQALSAALGSYVTETTPVIA